MKKNDSTLRLLHFSDVHIPVSYRGVPVRDWMGKRVVGIANLWLKRSKHFRHAREKLEKLSELARVNAVDACLCTGDYTTLGTEVELVAARTMMKPFEALGMGLLTVPGNHDIYLDDCVREQRFEKHFGDLLKSDLPNRCAEGPYPFVRFLGEHCAVIGVNTAQPNPEPWKSSGRISDIQLSTLRDLLRDPQIQSRWAVVMTHYAPRKASGAPDSLLHGLDNQAEFLDACSAMYRGIVLHGHIHRCFSLKLNDRPFHLFGAGSATQDHHEGFWVFDISKDALVAHRGGFAGNNYVLEENALEI